MSDRIKISPETLVWATERGGYNTDSLFNIYPKALEWIKEDSLPTVKQLERFAKKVHVPFGFLFLKKPPIETIPVTFYRSNGDVVNNPPLVIKDLVNTIKYKQDWLRDFLIESNYDELDFIGTLSDYKNIKILEAANVIRKNLNIHLEWYRETNKNAVFRYWIDTLENNRIFVISTGFVNNNKRIVDVDICKGFTLIDKFCPFIYINTNNLGGGRIFTLLHELVHIFVGNSIGLSYEPIHPSSTPLEKFCDEVASEILLPTEHFVQTWHSLEGNFYDRFTKIANVNHISKLVVMRKALDCGFIQIADFWSSYNSYTSVPYTKSTGGNYWNSKPYEVSRKFYSFVDQALKQGKILPTNAYKLTNMKGKTYENFKKKS